MSRTIVFRFAVWSLASMSFACLLGEFYKLWSMRVFACAILLPSLLVLGALWARGRNSPDHDWREAARWIGEGTIAGIFAAIIYDLYRVPFVMMGYPLFKVFPEFGRLLLGAAEPNWLIQFVGWTYHFSNGAALGIMFLAMVPRATPKMFVIAGVAWAMLVETILLLTPYRDFFKIHMPFTTFLILTATAHAIFGIALGLWCARRMPRTLPVS